MQSRLFATSFSLLCFASAVLSGVVVGNPSATVLGRGLVVLGLAYVVGRVLEGVASVADWSGETHAADLAPAEHVSEDSADVANSSSVGQPFVDPAVALRKAA